MFTDYCSEHVKKLNYPHYVAVLVMPRRARLALWALYAFKAEIDDIPRKVSEPMLRRIRQQWWLEAIERLYNGQVDAHPVIQAVHDAVRSGVDWQQSDFDMLIDVDGSIGADACREKLLDMSVAVTGEQKRAKLSRIFGYLGNKSTGEPDFLLPLKLMFL